MSEMSRESYSEMVQGIVDVVIDKPVGDAASALAGVLTCVAQDAGMTRAEFLTHCTMTWDLIPHTQQDYTSS